MKKFYFLVCLEVIVVAALIFGAGRALGQSGRAGFNGLVAFEGLAYVDKQPVAKVELVRLPVKAGEKETVAASVEADEHGIYHFGTAPLGDFVLRISAAGYKTYEAEVYIPSDFVGNLGVKLKKTK